MTKDILITRRGCQGFSELCAWNPDRGQTHFLASRHLVNVGVHSGTCLLILTGLLGEETGGPWHGRVQGRGGRGGRLSPAASPSEKAGSAPSGGPSRLSSSSSSGSGSSSSSGSSSDSSDSE